MTEILDVLAIDLVKTIKLSSAKIFIWGVKVGHPKIKVFHSWGWG